MRAPLIIAAAQPRHTAADLTANVLAHAEAVRDAQARVVVFPELSLTGYELDAALLATGDERLQPLVDACARSRTVALAGAPIVEEARRSIAALRIDSAGVGVAYRKTHLHGKEFDRFDPGDGPTVIDVDGWRIGMGICRDTGVDEHTAATAALGIDVYAAGVVHAADELGEQDARGVRIAAACRSYVAIASFAGPTGEGYDATAGESTIWTPDGAVLARAGAAPGGMARAELQPTSAVA